MDLISIEDFQKLDFRVGTVKDAVVPEWSHWVIRLTVDFGEELGEKNIFTGMLGFYEVESFIGKKFVFLVNLKPKNIGPAKSDGTREQSEGMLLAASVALPEPQGEHTSRPVLIPAGSDIPNGSKLV